MTTTPDHQSIEDAYRPPADMLDRLPDSVERREAKRLLDCSQEIAHVARERLRPEPGG